MEQKDMPLISDRENFYFALALFFILLAGDLAWWESRQAAMDFEQEASAIHGYVSNREARDLIKMNRDIDNLGQQVEEELAELENTSVE